MGNASGSNSPTEFQLKAVTPYDKQGEFEEYCAPVLEQLRRQCRERDIPFYFTAAVANSEEGTVFVNEGINPAINNQKLADDRIAKHMAVTIGCVVQPRNVYDKLVMNGADEASLDGAEDSVEEWE